MIENIGPSSVGTSLPFHFKLGAGESPTYRFFFECQSIEPVQKLNPRLLYRSQNFLALNDDFVLLKYR